MTAAGTAARTPCSAVVGCQAASFAEPSPATCTATAQPAWTTQRARARAEIADNGLAASNPAQDMSSLAPVRGWPPCPPPPTPLFPRLLCRDTPVTVQTCSLTWLSLTAGCDGDATSTTRDASLGRAFPVRHPVPGAAAPTCNSSATSATVCSTEVYTAVKGGQRCDVAGASQRHRRWTLTALNFDRALAVLHFPHAHTASAPLYDQIPLEVVKYYARKKGCVLPAEDADKM